MVSVGKRHNHLKAFPFPWEWNPLSDLLLVVKTGINTFLILSPPIKAIREKKPKKCHGFNEIRTRALRNTCLVMLQELSYKSHTFGARSFRWVLFP